MLWALSLDEYFGFYQVMSSGQVASMDGSSSDAKSSIIQKVATAESVECFWSGVFGAEQGMSYSDIVVDAEDNESN